MFFTDFTLSNSHSSPFPPLGFHLSSPTCIFFHLPFSFPSHRTSAAASNYYQFNRDNFYKRDVIVLRYASGVFQAYFLCLSLFSPFIIKLLKGAIFRLKNIFTKLLLPPQKYAALGGRLVRLVVKPALWDIILLDIFIIITSSGLAGVVVVVIIIVVDVLSVLIF